MHEKKAELVLLTVALWLSEYSETPFQIEAVEIGERSSVAGFLSKKVTPVLKESVHWAQRRREEEDLIAASEAPPPSVFFCMRWVQTETARADGLLAENNRSSNADYRRGGVVFEAPHAFCVA